MAKAFFYIVAVVIGLFIYVGIFGDDPEREPFCQEYSEDKQAMVMRHFNARSLVRDSLIEQKGCRLKLVLVVSDIASESYARQLADNFVRMTKSFGPEAGPKKKIGRGIYHYDVGVFGWPSEAQIARGYKDADATTLRF